MCDDIIQSNMALVGRLGKQQNESNQETKETVKKRTIDRFFKERTELGFI